MMSHLANSLREAIKTETDLFTMRVQQQVNRHCSIIETAAAFGAASPVAGSTEDLQLQINEIKETMSALMGEILGRRFGDGGSICSTITADILPDEACAGSNVVVNKVHPEEIKEVHINFDNESTTSSRAVSIATQTKSVEIVVENPAATAGAADEAVLGSPCNTRATNEAVAPENMSAGNEADDEGDGEYEEEVEYEVEDDQGEAEEEVVEDAVEEEEEGLEVEEIEYKGVKYYKDADGNVYECMEDGEIGEVIGSMSKKVEGKVLLYATQ